MAKPSWLTISPTTGSGNGSISNSASEHTGRVARTGTVTVTASGLATPKTYTVTQEPKPEFVRFNETEMSVAKTGGNNIQIQGKSNASKLTFAFSGEASGATIPNTYDTDVVSAANISNGATITGDPGADAEFSIMETVSIPANETVEPITRQLRVETIGGEFSIITITQAAGDPTLEIDPTSITIPQAGTAQTVAVTSNTSWTVS